jgi:hypothetical protein
VPQRSAPDSRLVPLGIVCIVLAVLSLLGVLYAAGSAAVAAFACEAMLALVHASKVTLPAVATKTLELVEQMVIVAAITTAVRMLPFGVLAILQLVLGVRLHGSDRRALRGLRKVAYALLAAIVFGLALQVAFVVPTQLDLLERLVKGVLQAVPWPGGHSPVGAFLPPSPSWAVAQPIVIAVVQTTWPIVLLIWAHKLRAAPPVPAAPRGQPPAAPWGAPPAAPWA